MNSDRAIHAFSTLGDLIISNLETKSNADIIDTACQRNPWFNVHACTQALSSIAHHLLNKEKLMAWTEAYEFPARPMPQTVAIVMAGNIPLVGWHDLMCVLISGHTAQVKLSSKDDVLPKYLIAKLIEIEPAFAPRIHLVEMLRDFDAVIATGSTNTSRYFEYYFGKFKNILRKNRVSVAVLDGTETEHQMYLLGKDIFSYFGLGCRSVSKIYVPRAGYDFVALLDAFAPFSAEVDFNKYDNNYTYQKSIMLINKIPHLDTGFLLMREDKNLASAVSVLHYEYFDDNAQLNAELGAQKDAIQCIVGDVSKGIANVPFGQTQSPELWDYADGVDTLKFLLTL